MKKIIFYIFIALLMLPVFQMGFHIFDDSKLSGSYTPAKDISISFEKWFSVEYQTKKETYIKENIGFRSKIILIYNQLSYSLFNMANNPGGVVGKNNYLYLESYIHNYTGENFIGQKKIDRVSKQLKYLQEYFADHGVSMFTVFVPSKASFYSEYIPDRFKTFTQTNYSAYLHAFDSLNIDYIDLNKYLISLKKDSKHPLFSRNGLHWTTYGMGIAIDSVLKKVEQIRSVDLPDFSWEVPVPMKAENFTGDYDAENLMNLYFDLPRDSMPYPNFIFHDDSTKQKPKTLVISDSYYWRAYSSKIPHNEFSWGGFWYYFNTARWMQNNKQTIKPIEDMDIEKLLLQQDVVILFASQATLHLYPYKFDEKGYRIFMPKDKESLIGYYTDQLVFNNSDEMAEKAKKNNLSFDDQVNADANWLMRKYLEEHPNKETEIEKIITNINKNPKWMAAIREKAIKRNITYEEMLKRDAEYMYNKRKQ